MKSVIRSGWMVVGALWMGSIGLGCAEGTGNGLSVSPKEVFTPSEATIEEVEDGTMIRLTDVVFTAGTATLSGGTESLNKFAELFARAPGARYRIEVHTDSAGSEFDNLEISQQRAEAVRNYLLAVVGGAPQALDPIGRGEAFPIGNNRTREGRAQNRRVEVIMLPDIGERVYRVRISADMLEIVEDCDEAIGSPSLEAGDFYITANFKIADDFGPELPGQTLAATSLRQLVQGNDGDLIELDIAAEGLFFARDSASLEFSLSWFEGDGGDTRQFDRADTIDLRWSSAGGCWEELRSLGVWRCVDETEGVIYERTWAYNNSFNPFEDACIVDLDWSISVERID